MPSAIGLQLARVPLVDRDRRHALGGPILQPDRIDQHQMADVVRIDQRVMRRQHAAGRMADHDGLFDAELGQQLMGVAGKLLEGELVGGGLARLAEADLVRRDHAIAGRDQILDGRLPGGGTKILAVQQHRGLPVRMIRLDVEIGHLQRLPLRGEREALDRERIVESFQFRSVGRGLSGRLLGRCGRDRGDRKRRADDTGPDC